MCLRFIYSISALNGILFSNREPEICSQMAVSRLLFHLMGYLALIEFVTNADFGESVSALLNSHYVPRDGSKQSF